MDTSPVCRASGSPPRNSCKPCGGGGTIENRVFWVFGVVFHEDHSRIRTGHALHVMNTIRASALNLIRGLGLPIAETLREYAFKASASSPESAS